MLAGEASDARFCSIVCVGLGPFAADCGSFLVALSLGYAGRQLGHPLPCFPGLAVHLCPQSPHVTPIRRATWALHLGHPYLWSTARGVVFHLWPHLWQRIGFSVLTPVGCSTHSQPMAAAALSRSSWAVCSGSVISVSLVD